MPKNEEKIIPLDSERLLRFERSLSEHHKKNQEHNLRLSELHSTIVSVKQDTTNIYGILGRLEVKLDALDCKLDRILNRMEISDDLLY